MSQESEFDEVTVLENSPLVIYEQDKAQIDVQISTAKQFPRNIKRSIENAVALVTMNQATAQTCTYALPRGGKSISGPSVHLAKILAQNWGNMRVEAKIVSVEQKHITSQAVAFDLENNLAIKVEVKRSIMTKTGRMNDDMIVVTGNAANAIALRNAILSVIPRGVVDQVYDSAKRTITGDLSDKDKLLKRRKQVFDTFKDDYGVSESEILKAIGKASISNITADDLVVIIGMGQSIKDGDSSVEEIFKNVKAKIDTDKLQQIVDLKSTAFELSTDDETRIDNIIKTLETASYDKAIAILLKHQPDAGSGE